MFLVDFAVFFSDTASVITEKLLAPRLTYSLALELYLKNASTMSLSIVSGAEDGPWIFMT